MPVRLPSQRSPLDEAIAQHQAKLVVIDPVVAFLDPGIQTNSDQSVRRVLGALRQIAARRDCAILMVRHLNKDGRGQARYRGGGSIGFQVPCRATWLVERDPATPEGMVLAQVKNNFDSRQPSLAFSLARRGRTAGANPGLARRQSPERGSASGSRAPQRRPAGGIGEGVPLSGETAGKRPAEHASDLGGRAGPGLFGTRLTNEELRLTNFSRVVSLPCREETIRGYPRVSLLVIDEAARVPDDLYRAVMPMLAVSNGRMICLSTPYGRRGYFYEAWGAAVTTGRASKCLPSGSAGSAPIFWRGERRTLGESWYRQEYECSFEALAGLVYPDFVRCVTPGPAPAGGRRVGGIDFGFRNPFAAIWGLVDRDGVLWLTGEHYSREKPLSYHAAHLPQGCHLVRRPIRRERNLRTALRRLRGPQGQQRLTSRHRGGNSPPGKRHAEGAGGCLSQPAGRGLPLSLSRERRGRKREPVGRTQPRSGGAAHLVSRIDERRMARTRRG